jgi:3-hydroxyisobutyrate dehydrogenase-like beta-hydroxyacid dehydrogenase
VNPTAFSTNGKKNTLGIGILYPGEMGSTLGRLLAENGFSVFTTLRGRSQRTRRLCEGAGLCVLPSLGEVLHRSDIVISLVPPRAALPMARKVARLAARTSRKLVYVDANSISPMTVANISEILPSAKVAFVDACIFGLASQLRQRGVLYLSGSRAEQVASHFRRAMRAKVVGEAPGQASALKMIVSGMPKGLVGLFVETMLFACDMGLLSEALEAYEEIYPGIMEIVRRMLPTYGQHAARRAQELKEAEKILLRKGNSARITASVRRLTAELAQVAWPSGTDPQRWTVAELIEAIHRSRSQKSRRKRRQASLKSPARKGSDARLLKPFSSVISSNTLLRGSTDNP